MEKHLKNIKNNWYLRLSFFIFTLGILITIIPIIKGAFFFTFDQARDALWVKNQIDFHRLSLIGPWGSLTGVFFGPLWFWLLTIPYIMSGGNPIAFTLFNAFLVYTTILLIVIVLYKYSPLISCFILILAGLSPGVSTLASTAFSQHLLPLFTLLFVYSLAELLMGSNPKFFYLALISASFMFHAEPPLFIFSLPSLLIIMFLSPNKERLFNIKTLLFGLVFFLIPFIPTLFFELRHDFLQSKAVISYLKGENRSLGDILPFYLRLIDRPEKFFSDFRLTIFRGPVILTLIVLITTLYVNIKSIALPFIKKIWRASVIYTISLLIIFTIYPPELKLFYLDGIQIIFLLWVAMAFTYLWNRGRLYRTIISLALLFAFWFNIQPLSYLQSYRRNFTDRYKDSSIFANQISVVDWIYQDASGRGFKVYTYQPAVYDYPYQYLFLWYAVDKYGYLPEDFSYLPNQPEYVQNKTAQINRLSQKIKPMDRYFYLIIEKDFYIDRTEKWLTNFSTEKYPLLERKIFPDQTIIEKRKI